MMDEQSKARHSAAAHGGAAPQSRGAALLCLGICLALLLAALLGAAPHWQSASASMENGLQKFTAAAHGGGMIRGTAEGFEKTAEPDPAGLKKLLAGVDECWHPLLARLHDEEMLDASVAAWFAALTDTYSSRPMGIKVTELFTKKFIPPYFPYFDKPVKPLELYPGVVTNGNMEKCHAFLQEHLEIFQKAEDNYNVPKEMLVSLLMVETRLGTFMGNAKAFWSLACMASAQEPESVGDYLKKLPYTDEHGEWLGDILKARSQWAYTELKALILYCRLHGHDPLKIRGSVYGAIGICQFMPSNIAFYAVDGDGDGKIDLFSLADAVPSAANFLKAHGWKKGTEGKKRVDLLKRYNKSTAYANTIIGLAEGVDKLVRLEAKKRAEAKKTAAAGSKPARGGAPSQAAGNSGSGSATKKS